MRSRATTQDAFCRAADPPVPSIAFRRRIAREGYCSCIFERICPSFAHRFAFSPRPLASATMTVSFWLAPTPCLAAFACDESRNGRAMRQTDICFPTLSTTSTRASWVPDSSQGSRRALVRGIGVSRRRQPLRRVRGNSRFGAFSSPERALGPSLWHPCRAARSLRRARARDGWSSDDAEAVSTALLVKGARRPRPEMPSIAG